MANQDDSFIREVNEEIRSEQMQAVWKRFGRLFIALAILVVIATAGKVAYDYWRERTASQSGDQFLAALTLAKDGKNDEALAALSALEKDGSGAYPVLARMRAATLQAQKGDTAAAIAAFDAIGKDNSIPPAIRDAARVRGGYLMIDTASYDQVVAAMSGLTDGAQALRHSAREVLGLSAYKAGDTAKAKEWFDQIAADKQAQPNIANRARIMLDLIASGAKS